MTETLLPARPALHGVPAPAGTRPVLRPGVRPAVRPGVRPGRRPVAPPPVDPWQWHEYANRVATVERAAWHSAADAVDQPSTDVRALVSLRDGGRAVGALGSRLGLTSGGATKMCRRLCGLGFVERHDVEDDQRGVQVKLTLAGRALADQAARVYADQVRRRAAGVPVPA